ncbi:MAG: PilN domain-containing protein [Bacteriovoracaceae bacterium]|nr:PilN domain-containing protein [Bacteriovoracaceae bacterium]
MIQVNLSTLKKPLDLANVGGFDLSKLNVKLVLLGIFMLYVPDFFFVDSFKAERDAADQQLVELNSQKMKLNKRVNALKEFDKQVQQLKRREQQLTDKLNVVKEIITKKKNPWSILVYVAKNIPPEIWLTEIGFSENKLTFKGLSLDYTNQGLFLENLKKSIFFEKNIIYSKTDTESLPPEMKNLAPFEITATITRFE